MVRQIAPVFFTTDIPATIAYYKGKLGFACLGTWQHALALPRVRGQGLRRPPAGLRREPVVFFQGFVVAGL
jgi:hypothetical protein